MEIMLPPRPEKMEVALRLAPAIQQNLTASNKGRGVNTVLHIMLRVINAQLCHGSHCAGVQLGGSTIRALS